MTDYKAHSLLIGMPTCSRSFARLPVTEESGINETCLFFFFFFFSVRFCCKIHREHQPLFSEANQRSSVPICASPQLCKLVSFPPTQAILVTWSVSCFIRQNQQRQFGNGMPFIPNKSRALYLFFPLKGNENCCSLARG